MNSSMTCRGLLQNNACAASRTSRVGFAKRRASNEKARNSLIKQFSTIKVLSQTTRMLHAARSDHASAMPEGRRKGKQQSFRAGAGAAALTRARARCLSQLGATARRSPAHALSSSSRSATTRGRAHAQRTRSAWRGRGRASSGKTPGTRPAPARGYAPNRSEPTSCGRPSASGCHR